MILLITILSKFLVFYILLLGLNLIVGKTRVWAFGHVGFFGLGTFLAVFLPVKCGFDPWSAAFVAVLFSCLCAIATIFISWRFDDETLLVFTLVFAQIVYSLTILVGGPRGFYGFDRPDIWWGILRQDQWYTVTVLLPLSIFSTGLYLRFVKTPLHRVCYFAKDHPESAILFNINPAYYRAWIFGLGSTIAAIAGVLYAWLIGGTDPSVCTPHWGILLFALILVGGVDSILGTIVGALILSITSPFLAYLFEFSSKASFYGGQISQIIFGIFLIIAIRFFPQGLVGTSRTWLKGGY